MNMLDMFKDKKSLIFIDSRIEFMKMKTGEDFVNLEDFEIVSEDDVITYQSVSNIGVSNWQKDSFEEIKTFQSSANDKFNTMVEVSFEKITYEGLKTLNSSFAVKKLKRNFSSKKMIKLRIMTFDIVDMKSVANKVEASKYGTGTYEKTQTIVIKPKQILERDIEDDGKYNLQSLIVEFQRNNKLDDLGI